MGLGAFSAYRWDSGSPRQRVHGTQAQNCPGNGLAVGPGVISLWDSGSRRGTQAHCWRIGGTRAPEWWDSGSPFVGLRLTAGQVTSAPHSRARLAPARGRPVLSGRATHGLPEVPCSHRPGVCNALWIGLWIGCGKVFRARCDQPGVVIGVTGTSMGLPSPARYRSTTALTLSVAPRRRARSTSD